MFEIGWSELLVIGVVLIVVVGPKDLPKMLRTFGKTTTQLKKMAGDFRRQFDEALREAELDEVRDNLKSMNPTKDLRTAMNPIRAVGDEIRSSLMAATKAPEPKVPSANAPAMPAEPSVVGNADMQPLAPAPSVAGTAAPVADTAVPGTAAPATAGWQPTLIANALRQKILKLMSIRSSLVRPIFGKNRQIWNGRRTTCVSWYW